MYQVLSNKWHWPPGKRSNSYHTKKVTSWESTCSKDTRHSVPRKQLASYCCLGFWLMDNMNLSTKPSPGRWQWTKWEAEWGACSVKWSAMSAFYLFLLGSQVDGTAQRDGGLRGGKILSRLRVYPTFRLFKTCPVELTRSIHSLVHKPTLFVYTHYLLLYFTLVRVCVCECVCHLSKMWLWRNQPQLCWQHFLSTVRSVCFIILIDSDSQIAVAQPSGV